MDGLCGTARGDRMKQANVDAKELIDGYRGEKQQEFNNNVLAAGNYFLFLLHLSYLYACRSVVCIYGFTVTSYSPLFSSNLLFKK